MTMQFEGKVWKFGDNVDTDAIIPARFLNVSDKDQLAKGCFIDLRPEFRSGVQPGDILVAGSNFGCGSSREHAPLAIKASGVSAVVARSFARIFYRNAFNMGLPIFESADLWDRVSEGQEIEVDGDAGGVVIIGVDSSPLVIEPIPPFMQALIRDGGLMSHLALKRRA
jgi:3-isopropylmalate/(R)-2-methylmalate dehydratase small subunit